MAHCTFEEASRLVDDPLACFTRVTSTRHIILPPKYIGKLKTGVKEQLDTELKLYSDRLEGVIIAYDNIKLSQRFGTIIDEYPCVHLDVTADLILFKPPVGAILNAVVNKIGKDHIGCLVHGCFNASINKRGLQSTDTNAFSIGQELKLSVFKLVSQNGVLSIKGNVIEESIVSVKEINDESASDGMEQHGKKKKHKKPKHDTSITSDSLDNSEINVSGNRNNGQENTKLGLSATADHRDVSDVGKSKKKKKKHKKIKQEMNADAMDLVKDEELTDSSSTKKKHKKKRETDHGVKTELFGDSNDVLLNNENGDESVDISNLSQILAPSSGKKKKKKKSKLGEGDREVSVEKVKMESATDNSIQVHGGGDFVDKKEKRKQKRSHGQSVLIDGDDAVPAKKARVVGGSDADELLERKILQSGKKSKHKKTKSA